LVEEERHAEALRVQRLNVELHPDRSRAHFGLAASLSAAGQDEAARRAYEEKLRRPDDPSLYPALRVVIEVVISRILE
jgi:Flp pilus assembly protein TadD